MTFTEDSRVKIPCILHLMRLGYDYLSLKGANWDEETNIFPTIFKSSLAKINPGIDSSDIDRAFDEARICLDNEDLGKEFFEKLSDQSGLKFIDFANFDANTFHVVTELTCKNGDDEFRPDVTLLINGMPLAFIEVKKPNNREGVLAERNRMVVRCRNSKFRRFLNITQVMVFSNNMEYDDNSPDPIEGAFYAAPSYDRPDFNYFREEGPLDLAQILKPEDDALETAVLKDNNLAVIKHTEEFATNKSPESPTNRICTSLFSKERLKFLLQYAIAYVNEPTGLQKHIMRYPQLFATRAIRSKLEEGITKGIIWHTQGSGKTALAYFAVKYLTHYFREKGIVPKFYFIVDRIDLLTQAQGEFSSRGLVVHPISSREAFAKDIKATKAIHNDSGRPEITVVNIQKFEDDPDVVRTSDYDVSIQRIYFLDEVHRSYNPKGSFLANLAESDSKAIKIGLTGTPLLNTPFAPASKRDGDQPQEKQQYNSKTLFGDYIHKYYYNASIADGYTLRLIREAIATEYKSSLKEALESIETEQGTIKRKELYAHPKFVEPMLDYIISDFEKSRQAHGDTSIGAMVICDSSEQAEEMFDVFRRKYGVGPTGYDRSIAKNETLKLYGRRAAEAGPSYTAQAEAKSQPEQATRAILILHDVGSKDERKEWVDSFKTGGYDILFVYNMLLTGFDAKRLKKLYLGRVIKKHNLLQALTRVNRTYKSFRYGYVVDFADIEKEFEATNKTYFDELQAELGDEMETYSNLFKTEEEIQQDIDRIKDALFQFDTTNAEKFSQQVSAIQDRAVVQDLKKALTDARNLYNIIRLQGAYDFLADVDFQKLSILLREVSNHLDLLNLKDNVENGTDTSGLLNVALEDVIFLFTKVKEEELVLADQLKNTLRQTREALGGNFDPKDPEFISLREELERLFKKKKLSEVSQEEMTANIDTLRAIHDKIKQLNRENARLRDKFHGDAKYARVHKRLREQGAFTESERKIFEALNGVKAEADEQVLQNVQILQNESYFTGAMTPIVINQFKSEQGIALNANTTKAINALIVTEYLNEMNAGSGMGVCA